ncbi:hypothetical protein NNO_0060 [Hydrogenimonas sp.]|nr:hypothetical protein NNO_0060 [Hydrogenimonas sp.]
MKHTQRALRQSFICSEEPGTLLRAFRKIEQKEYQKYK